MKEKIKEYARLLVKKGVNVQQGQVVVIHAPAEAYEFARLVAHEAYEAGAKVVRMEWNDEKIAHDFYQFCSEEEITNIPYWQADRINETAKEGACYIHLIGEDPALMADINPFDIAARSIKMNEATKTFRDLLDSGKLAWTIGGVPTKAWAKAVYPDLSGKKAVKALWKDILQTARVEKGKTLSNWDQRKEDFEKRMEVLNSMNIASLHYKNEAGTDFTVELPEGYRFVGGGSYLPNGIYYVPNIPTEELFSAPVKSSANGILKASLPLIHNGRKVEDFWFRFENGKVTEYDAKEGKDVIESILKTDEESSYLGEIAFVEYDSPISNMNKLFYNTLYDENASCHFALGQTYSECLKNAESMSRQELIEKGMNQSKTHVDFMVGTKDLSITAVLKDGTTKAIFENGNFAPLFD